MDDERLIEETRKSWNAATRIHNAHKKDQAGFFKAGHSTLFPEEQELVGDVAGRSLLHLMCNCGQDSLSWAAKGAKVTGVDLSDNAIAFAQRLSSESGIGATFVRSEIIAWLESTEGDGAFDVAVASYGALPWVRDLPRLFRGVAKKIKQGGRFVFVEYHPLVWSFTDAWSPTRDPYFAPGRAFVEPVGDYVGKSGAAATGKMEFVDVKLPENTAPAHSWQHTVADIVQAVVDAAGAGLALDAIREWPYANGCRIHDGCVDVGEGRFGPAPSTKISLPMMLGVRALKF